MSARTSATPRPASATPPAFVGSIDYFFNVDTPIVPEDGGVGPDEHAAGAHRRGGPRQVCRPHGQATVDVERPTNRQRPESNGAPTPVYGSGPVIDNVAVTSHEAIIEPLICGSSYNYRVASNDASATTRRRRTRRSARLPCPAGAFSDNFDTPALDSRWFVDDPRRRAAHTARRLLSLSVPGWPTSRPDPANNGALVRLLQPVPNCRLPGPGGIRVGRQLLLAAPGHRLRADEATRSFGSTCSVTVRQHASVRRRPDVDSPGRLVPNVVVERRRARHVAGDEDRRQLAVRVFDRTRCDLADDLRRQRSTSRCSYGPVRRQRQPADRERARTHGVGRLLLVVHRPDRHHRARSHRRAAVHDLRWQRPRLGRLATRVRSTGPHAARRQRVGPRARSRRRHLDHLPSQRWRSGTMGIGSTNCDVGISCTRRLANNGDFNADIDASLLDAGLNTVTIRAVDSAFNVSTLDVPVNYTPGRSCRCRTPSIGVRAPMSTTFAADRRPLGPRGRHATHDEIGYDRLLAVGDGTGSRSKPRCRSRSTASTRRATASRAADRASDSFRTGSAT